VNLKETLSQVNNTEKIQVIDLNHFCAIMFIEDSDEISYRWL